MNIAHFTFEYPPSTTGGLGTYLQGLVEYQKGMGDQVDVFFLSNEQPPARTIHLPFYKNEQLVSYNLNQINQLCKHVKYDVVVCQEWEGILASQPLWTQGIPLVTTCHLPLAWDIGYQAEDIACKFAGELEFFAMAQSDLIIAVSNSVKRQLEQSYTFTQGKIKVVHNGTDTSFFSPGIKSDQPIVLYVGRFGEQKGFDLLPDIFSLLKQSHPRLLFKIIGIGPLKSEVSKKFEALNLAKSIQFYEFSPPEKVLELYREATVVIMPSRFEPCSLVAIESMATGTPLVASNVGGLAEIITHGEDGFLVRSNDVSNFAQAVSLLLNDKQLAITIGQNARTTILKSFDKKTCFERTRNLYIDLINNSDDK